MHNLFLQKYQYIKWSYVRKCGFEARTLLIPMLCFMVLTYKYTHIQYITVSCVTLYQYTTPAGNTSASVLTVKVCHKYVCLGHFLGFNCWGVVHNSRQMTSHWPRLGTRQVTGELPICWPNHCQSLQQLHIR